MAFTGSCHCGKLAYSVDEDLPTRELVARTVLDASLAEREAYVVANNNAAGSAPLTLFSLAERIATWKP